MTELVLRESSRIRLARALAYRKLVPLESKLIEAHSRGALPDKIAVPCCACPGEVTFVVPKTDLDRPTMFHTVPYCARFNETNTADGIVQYLRDCAPQRERIAAAERMLTEARTPGSALKEFKRVTGFTPIEFVAFLKKLALQVPLPPLTSALNVEVATMGVAHVLWSAMPELSTEGELEAAMEILLGTTDPAILRVRNTLRGVLDRLSPSPVAVNLYMSFLRRWRESSYARLEVGHKLAAALCLTDIPDDLEIGHPWDAWSLIVPDGLLGELARIWVAVPESGDGKVVCFFIDRRGYQITNSEPQFTKMAISLVIGCALALSNPEDFRKDKQRRPTARSAKHRTGGSPDLGQARFMLSAPVSIDLRDHVREALSGKTRRGGSPTVQFLVRGHWRQQAHGPARALRKTLWIQPFWKGPEESRVLLRTYKADK